MTAIVKRRPGIRIGDGSSLCRAKMLQTYWITLFQSYFILFSLRYWPRSSGKSSLFRFRNNKEPRFPVFRTSPNPRVATRAMNAFAEATFFPLQWQNRLYWVICDAVHSPSTSNNFFIPLLQLSRNSSSFISENGFSENYKKKHNSLWKDFNQRQTIAYCLSCLVGIN